jgi:Arc/MetJ family transcription regulator
MTPDDLIGELRKLVRVQRYREAVELALRRVPEIRSQMTPEHAVRLHEIMHIADIFDDVETSADGSMKADAAAQRSVRDTR